jgi:cytoplasmic iron level regulating protein YaaA (DUF328/UPF0246 family)
MLFLLSPAKSLDYETPVPAPLRRKVTEPQYLDEAEALIAVLKKKSPRQVAALMDLSDNLAALNAARYAAWQRQATPANSKPAVLAFDGDVYDGLQARTLATADLSWAQRHLVILSGLYGVLRPFDALQPYRLEMGTALATPRGKDLYAFWGDTVAEHLNTLQADEAAPVVVNLASVEYARVALRKRLRARVVDCVFEEIQPGGEPKVISFFAKRARGLMARHAITTRARSVKALLGFDADGYRFEAADSTAERLVFRRPFQPRVAPRAAARGGERAGAPALAE